MRTRSLTDILSSVILIIMITCLGILIFLLAFPYKVIEFKSVTPLKESYKAGEVFDLEISYCKYLPLSARMTRQFIDGVIYTLPEIISGNAPSGCGTNIAKDINIPLELTPGTYYYKQTMTYKVNPIREVVVEFQTPTFEVIK